MFNIFYWLLLDGFFIYGLIRFGNEAGKYVLIIIAAVAFFSWEVVNSIKAVFGPKNTNLYNSYHVSGKEIMLDPTPEKRFETATPSTTKPYVSSPVASKPQNKQRFCKYCGGAINSETKQCTSCGKQFFKPPKASSSILIVTIVVLAVLIGISGLFISNYNKGIEAMNNQQFIIAQQYFDNLVVGKSLFSDEYAYIEAGVLMETGKYLEAYKAFNALENIPVPVSISNKLQDQIYSIGVKAYDSNDLDTAKKYFSNIEDYGKSSNFLLLISCKQYYAKANLSYEKLFELIDFKDTKEIILNNSSLFKKFLSGRWEAKNTHSYYFELQANDDGSGYTSQYNLPYEYVDGYFFLNNGIYMEGETETSAINIFRFSIIDKDTISVYCYKDGSTHELHCVKRHVEPVQTPKIPTSLKELEW